MKRIESYPNLIVKLLAWIPAIIIAILIFGFSSQNANDSNSLSNKAASFIVKITQDLRIIETSADSHQKYIDDLQFPIRKIAHMTEYMIFAFSVLFAFYVWTGNIRTIYFKSFILVALFACTDEFHQLFVPGRSGRIADVFIDCTGAAIGLYLVWSFRKSKNKLVKETKVVN